jgi:4-diphosphocytidyl-2-C-methyl-D-erythritol kinase
VVRRRQDGFHDLASLFHVIDLGDAMSFEPLPPSATADELTCDMPDVPTDGSNLVIKALNLFRSKTGASMHFRWGGWEWVKGVCELLVVCVHGS